MINNEKIMVCLKNGPTGDILIQRGSKLAKLLHCPLFILTVLPQDLNELDAKQNQYLKQWKEKCDELGATFIVKAKERRRPSEVIKEVASNYDITQLMIGQSGQTRWQEIIHGCFFNDLLNGLGEIDLHVVSFERYNEERQASSV